MREQAARTRVAFKQLFDAHRELLTAELRVTADELKILAAIAGIILGLALLLVTLVYTGAWLFVGEWLFGSIGWGLLHGALATIAAIVLLALFMVHDSSRPLILGTVLAVIVGVLLSILFASNVLRSIAEAMADQVTPSLSATTFAGWHVTLAFFAVAFAAWGLLVGLRSAPWRRGIGGFLGALIGLPIALAVVGALFGFALGGDGLEEAAPIIVAAVALAVILAVLGFTIGIWRGGFGTGVDAFLAGLMIGLVAGALAGAVTYDLKGAIAVALVVALIAWPILAFAFAQREGIDPQKRFEKLMPKRSMAAFEETRSFLEDEWKRQRTKLTNR